MAELVGLIGQGDECHHAADETRSPLRQIAASSPSRTAAARG
jgi:hypothetical protein